MRFAILFLASSSIAGVIEAVLVAQPTRHADALSEVRHFLGLVSQATASTAADEELGADASLSSGSDGSEPRTLDDYCSGKVDEQALQEDQRVEANWRGFGIFYPGKVVHSGAHSVTVAYDDGFDEKVKDKNRDDLFSRVLPLPGDEKVASSSTPHPEDAACELNEMVKDVTEKVSESADDIDAWIENKKKEHSQQPAQGDAHKEEAVPKVVVPSVASPAPAVAVSDEQAEKLETLTGELTDLDARIAAARDRLSDNTLKLQNEASDGDAGEVTGIDALIASYQRRVDDRRRVLADLENRILAQESALARASEESALSLEEIDKKIEAIDKDMVLLRKKRDALEFDERLDDELRVAVDNLLAEGDALHNKYRTLRDAEEKAKKAREMASARKQDRGGGQQPEASVEVSEGTSKRSQIESETPGALERDAKSAEDLVRAAEAADQEVFSAAQEVGKKLNAVTESTRDLDTNVHPHGRKWWRYRYEHAYIEAVLMVIVCVFLYFWESVARGIRWKVMQFATVEEMHVATDGGMFVMLLKCFSIETFACLMTFMTIWVLSLLNAWDLFPMFFHSDKMLRVPHQGAEYRRLAVDICMLLFCAIMLYFALAYSVVLASTRQMEVWQTHEVAVQEEIGKRKLERKFSTSSGTGHVGSEKGDYELMRAFFIRSAANDAVLVEALRDTELSVGQDFPFWLYLRMNVRSCVDSFFKFGSKVWVPVIVTFLFLSVLHSTFHVGYIRVMSFFTIVMITLFVLMGGVVHQIADHLQGNNEISEDLTPSWFAKAEWAMGFVLNYVVFFICWCAARFLCQPWMWTLHFWPVLGLSLLLIAFCATFHLLFAETIPSFAAVMAMPPFMDNENAEIAKQILSDETILKHV
uniref:Uncharacterized protein n=1 Tax=Noctiluca scintillans TaxID=2966 RepID=A0A7S1AM73_NOCSC|mmetsp:Transcript_52118/g.138877  ORF Transcript_52118/g.138877 Transcript_52118/m.138877 type:complete len:873 (+) Transcript_52118:84-2702(+)